MNKKLVYVGGKYGGVEENKKLIEKAISYLKTKDKDTLNSWLLFDMVEKVYISPIHSFGFMYEDTEYLEGLDYCWVLKFEGGLV